jgi:hypothetical protein
MKYLHAGCRARKRVKGLVGREKGEVGYLRFFKVLEDAVTKIDSRLTVQKIELSSFPGIQLVGHLHEAGDFSLWNGPSWIGKADTYDTGIHGFKLRK